MGNEQLEPSASLRSAAYHIRQMFVALTEAGFSETQALSLVTHLLTGKTE